MKLYGRIPRRGKIVRGNGLRTIRRIMLARLLEWLPKRFHTPRQARGTLSRAFGKPHTCRLGKAALRAFWIPGITLDELERTIPKSSWFPYGPMETLWETCITAGMTLPLFWSACMRMGHRAEIALFEGRKTIPFLDGEANPGQSPTPANEPGTSNPAEPGTTAAPELTPDPVIQEVIKSATMKTDLSTVPNESEVTQNHL